MEKSEKAKKIKATLLLTKARRKKQLLKTYQLKLQNLSKTDIKNLNQLFVEAKWLRNYIVANIPNRLTSTAWKLKEVEIKNKEGAFEKRKLEHLSSQMRAGVVKEIKTNLWALKKAKEKQNKVGGLKFKGKVFELPLNQYGNTYSLNFETNRLHIQKIKKAFRVLGLYQIPEKAEFANAQLLKKPSGFYLATTVFLKESPTTYKTKKGIIKNKMVTSFNKPLGIDFGIKTQLTFSTGMKITYKIKESEKLKKLQRALAHKQKFIIWKNILKNKKRKKKLKIKVSKNALKIIGKINKEYESLNNQKKDIQNRVVAYAKSYKQVYFQDENIKGWQHGLFGKAINNTSIGGIIASLKTRLETPVLLNRYLPTTKTCSKCGHKQKMTLSNRIFICESCGMVLDRDVNSARDMVRFGRTENEALAPDWDEVTPVEKAAAGRVLERNSNICLSYPSSKQEAPAFLEERMSREVQNFGNWNAWLLFYLKMVQAAAKKKRRFTILFEGRGKWQIKLF
jgi:transposase